ncbi:MAG: hypothetical protein WD273_11590 [Trueperaceae bacterium]
MHDFPVDGIIAVMTFFTRRLVANSGRVGARPTLLNLTPIAQLHAGKLPVRLVHLFVGLTIFGFSMSLMIRSQLGMLPWDVLHYGVATHLPLSIGTIIILASVAVLLFWIPLRQRLGLGTVANAIWIGIATDATLFFLPVAPNLAWQVAFMVSGVVLNAMATAMYIGTQLGPGPRDGLMTGLSRVTGKSLRLVRTGLEVVVVVAGWLLGGVVGLGTLLFALSIGPLIQFFLPSFIVDLGEEPIAEPS